MNRLRAKLKSESGASILLALAFLLLCLTVGGVILTAATASAGRMASQRQTQQDYLTVSSAASVLRDALDGAVFTVTATTVDGGSPAYGYSLRTAVKTPLGSALESMAETVSDGRTPSPKPLTIQAPELDEVSGSLALDGTYGITVTLSLTDGEGNSRQPMTLTIPAAVGDPTWETYQKTIPVEKEDEDGNLVMDEYTETTVVETRRVTWSGGSIAKGAAG